MSFECLGRCGRSFRSERAAEQHEAATGHDKLCGECGVTFRSVGAREAHDRAGCDGHEHECLCGRGQFISRASLGEHADATGHAVLCDECDAVLSDDRALAAHYACEHDGWACHFCDRVCGRSVCARACLCVRACVCACVCVRACARVCVRVCMCMCLFVRMCACVRACVGGCRPIM
jgi:hypothetical protein